jgi:phosphoribosylanthranilate isomerase
MRNVRVKICGLTRPGDAAASLALGADYLGVIFAPSPRQVTVEQATAIRGAAPGASLVGVFAGASGDEIAAVARGAGLDMIQLHGGEPLGFCETTGMLTGLPVIRALPASALPGGGAPTAAWNGSSVPRGGHLLLDLDKNEPPGKDSMHRLWETAALAEGRGLEIFLAGGLDPSNVRAAVERAAPFCVDVCRGVETAPGVKDAAAIEEFIAEVKRAR